MDKKKMEKTKEKILDALIAQRNAAGNVYKPGHFLSSFKRISEDDVADCLAALDTEGIIRVVPGGGEDNDNLLYIAVYPKALNYVGNAYERRREKRMDRLWGFALGLASGVLATLVAQWFAQFL